MSIFSIAKACLLENSVEDKVKNTFALFSAWGQGKVSLRSEGNDMDEQEIIECRNVEWHK